MKADTHDLQHVFQGDRRFIIPVYQRPYVWDRERQWEPLWEDVEATAIRLAQARNDAHQRDKPGTEADKAAPPHFLGAIVLEQLPHAMGEVEVRSVVDGQQRLTTVQLLLHGVLDALTAVQADARLIARLRKLIRNDAEILTGDALYKVWPRPADQTAYLKAVALDAPVAADSRFAAARDHFASAALDFLKDDNVPDDPYAEGPPVERRASLLVATVLGLVKLVVIDLEDVDDAQVIFEALNARNTPLSATDLVKNLLFMRAQAEHADAEDLYQSVWARFDADDEWWRGQVGVGHAQRARQDWLLGDWLIAQLGRVINVGRLYGEFRRWLDVTGVKPRDALDTLSRYADAYEVFSGRREGASPHELRAFQTIQRMNITAATPVLLWLLVQPPDELDPAERERAVQAIESYVVRRMAIKAQTRAYGHAFADVLRTAQEASSHPGDAVVDALVAAPHGYTWPSDEEVAREFESARYYGAGGINQGRLRLILGAIDQRVQSLDRKGEPADVAYDKLQIEHIIPRSWRKHWPVSATNENERLVKEQERAAHVHRLGNLTLTSGPLNASLSNNPWETKKTDLRKHTHLRLNALLIDQSEWGEVQIRERGRWLASHFVKIWGPPPASAVQLPKQENASDVLAPQEAALAEVPLTAAETKVVQPAELSSTDLRYRDFWSRFLAEIRLHRPEWSGAEIAPAASWFSMASGRTHAAYVVSFGRRGFLSELALQHPDPDVNTRRLSAFVLHRDEMESAAGCELLFEPMDGRKQTRIALTREADFGDTAEWEGYINWLIESQTRIRRAVEAAGGIPNA